MLYFFFGFALASVLSVPFVCYFIIRRSFRAGLDEGLD